MKRLLFCLAIILGAGAFLFDKKPAAQPDSDGYTAAMLYADCKTDPHKSEHDAGLRLTCAAFMRGLVVGIFGLQTWQNGSTYTPLCLPTRDAIDPESARQWFVEYVEQHPELLSKGSGAVASTTTIGHYICH